MVTDGLLACGTRPFEDSHALYKVFMEDEGKGNLTRRRGAAEKSIEMALARVHEEQGRDSATVIQWSYENLYPGAEPSG